MAGHSADHPADLQRSRSYVALLALLALVASACGIGGSGSPDPDSQTTPIFIEPGAATGSGADSGVSSVESLPFDELLSSATGLRVRLSNGAPSAPSASVEAGPAAAVVEGEALTASEVDELLSRVGSVSEGSTEAPAEEVDVNRPAETLLPPTAETRVDLPFPPDPTSPLVPDAPAEGPLEVLRVQPQGNVDTAPFLSVTFNEPMIPLSTLTQLDQLDVPVEITPSRETLAERGFVTRWRWLGTRTARLEAVPSGAIGEVGVGDNSTLDRLPGSTEFAITIPEGTESVNGARLETDAQFTFTTRTPEPVWAVGFGDRMDLTPVLAVEFDQRVNPEAALGAIQFEAGDVTSVRLATDDEVAEALADPESQLRWLDAAADRVIYVTPTESLSANTAVRLQVGPGVPSLEGPLLGTQTFTETGRTFPPLRLDDDGCNGDCVPLQPLVARFTNRIDADAFDPAWVTISPELPGARVEVSGSAVVVRGATNGNTDYDVFFSGELLDIYGQTLGEQARADFDVGDAPRAFAGPTDGFVITDPFVDAPGVTYQSVNHDALRVRAWSMLPGQYSEFLQSQGNLFSNDWRPGDWPELIDTEVPVDAIDDTVVETTVDLTNVFAEAAGPVAILVEPADPVSRNDDEYWNNRPVLTWVQDTDLAVDVFSDGTELVVWATEFTTGDPVASANVRFLGGGDETLTTDEFGLLRVALDSIPLDDSTIRGVAVSADGESVVSPRSNWSQSERGRSGLWFVTDDRGLYRPGETVRVVGFYRWPNTNLRPTLTPNTGITYRVVDSRGSDLGNGELELNEFGAFSLAIDLPAGTNAGNARLILNRGPNNSTTHSFQVQDFRTPDFEASVEAVDPAPYIVGEPTTFAAAASYFAGGPLSNSPVQWFVSTQDGSYAPPNWGDFSFGEWVSPWFSGYDDGGFSDFGGGFGGFNPADVTTFTGTTDVSGRHLLQADFSAIDDTVVDQPSSVRLEATVTDVNRQSISASTAVVVHPAEYYVGLRSDASFVEPGESLVVDTVVVDLDGAPVAGRSVEVTAGVLRESFTNGRFVSEVIDPQTCVVTSTADQVNSVNSSERDAAMRCTFEPETPGRWEISAVVLDDDERQNRATLNQWVSGGTATSIDGIDGDAVTIIPNAESYAPGDTAEILVQAPFASASGLLIIDRAGFQSVEPFDAPDGSAILTLPIASADIPNINVRVEMVGVADRRDATGAVLDGAPQQPAFATGQLRLSIPPAERTLEVRALPAVEQATPGESTSVDVQVVDANGEAVAGAGVSVIVVDEAVLSLTGFELGDPIDAFYPPVGSTVRADLLRTAVLLAPPEIILPENVDTDTTTTDVAEALSGEVFDGEEEAMEDDGGDDFAAAAAEPASARVAESADDGDSGANEGADNTPIDLRDNFASLAVFAPEEVTGADGSATVEFDLPDSLTRYRVMAIATSGADRFGTGEAQITARLPLSIRPTAPAFLNFGDEFELPVVVQNLSDEAADVDLAVAVENLELTGDAGMRVTVPANSRIEVRFAATTASVGTATMQVVATSDAFADAAFLSIPVFTPATSEAFATYGVLEGGQAIAQQLVAPTNVLTAVGGLDISTSSTAVSALTDAVLYLHEYRYETADGFASRIMAVAALRDVLEAFDADGLPAPDVLDARVQDDVDALIALQDGQGTWSWWRRNGEIAPWVTVQATHALVLAEQNGYDVDGQALENALNASSEIDAFFNPEDERTTWAVRAYGLYVANLAGRNVSNRGEQLFNEAGDGLGLGSAAQLLTVVSGGDVYDQILRRIENGAVETPSAATFATSFGENGYLIAHSDRRTDGIVLDALVREEPDNDLIIKTVNGLLANQRRGRWNNAQENAFILLAMNEYFGTFEDVTPDFIARAWLGETYVNESEFVGRSTDTLTTRVPMSEVVANASENSASDIVVSNDGSGRLYYRLGLDYAPSDFDLPPRDEGFVVARTYEAIDDASDVRQLDDGTWEIRAGANVRVNVTMVADARRNQVALVDPLAAGLEAVNPAFQTSQTIFEEQRISEDQPFGSFYYRQWFNHQNLRSDRVEAFATRLWGGTFEYSYVAQATIPGSFVVPPATAEEIFNPEVFGRSASDRVVVVDR